MSIPTIKPAEARRLLDSGALLIDIREADEHAREKIPGARHLPLSKLDEAHLAVHQVKPVIFHCKSGARTQANAPRLAGKLGETCEAFVGAGLITAGLTGFCGMARILMRAPWNRRVYGSPGRSA